MLQNEQSEGRRKIVVLALRVDRTNQIRRRDVVAPVGDLLQPVQNSSSRLTLVLRPASTTERLTMDDFMVVALGTMTDAPR